MNPLVRKELRLILPFWGIAMFLAIVPSFITPGDAWVSGINEIIFWAFGFGAVLLGLAPFGQEFSLGTFPALLAQPLERRQMWKTKILLIVIAALLVTLAFLVAVHFRLVEDLRDSMERFVPLQGVAGSPKLVALRQSTVDFYHSYFWISCVAGGALLMLVGIAGGFWSSLLFRQVGAALWFAILIPAAILVSAELISHLFQVSLSVILFPAFGVYAVAGFIWARRMFFAAQDVQWLGGTVSFLSLSPTTPQTESVTVRRKKPFAALLRKELQSHQVSFLIAFGLLVLHIATLVFRGFTNLSRNSELRFAVEAVPLLWLMLPWVMGSVAVAEERKLGTMESQLCLPVTRRLQWFVKLFVVLLLGVVLGGLIPCLIEGLGVLAHVPSAIVQPDNAARDGIYFSNVLEITFGAFGIAFISFFASTLTRNTLHALGASIVLAGIFIALFIWLTKESSGYYYSFWRGSLVFLMAIPVWIIAVTWLSFSNYKRLHAGGNVWLRNFLILSISLVCSGLVAAVIYQRPWELGRTLEPKHGPARLSGPVRPVICGAEYRIFALLPDGRLWVATDYEWKTVKRYRRISENMTNEEEFISFAIPHSGMFVGGSNWVALAAPENYSEVIALQSDGSLWSIVSQAYTRTNYWKKWFEAVPDPKRIGSDNDWKSIAAGQAFYSAVKKDGTLWGWGPNMDFAMAHTATQVPVPIETGTDWARVFSGRARPLFVKENGDVFQMVQDKGISKLSSMNLNASDWVDVDSGYQQALAVLKDGSLRAWNVYGEERIFDQRISFHWVRNGDNTFRVNDRYIRIGNDSDWVQVSGEGAQLFGLKKDGRIVKNPRELFSGVLSRPSAYSDWLAVYSHWDGLAALSADGTISQWQDLHLWAPERISLAPTRRPLWNLNIFTDVKN